MINRLFFALISLTVTANAFAGVTIADLYYGSNRNQDVWGDATVFNTHSMTVDVTNTKATFTVHSNFIGYLNHWRNYGARLGDLFFQFDPWTPHGTQSWTADDMSSGTKWDFALHLKDLPTTGAGTTPGSGAVSLYAIDESKYTTQIISSDEFWNDPNNDGSNADRLSGSVRENQEVLIDTSSDASLITAGVTGGGWVVDTSAKTLEMTLEGDMSQLFGFDATQGGVVAFHWAMTCANDTIEGEAQIPASQIVVPEPSTAAIFGLSLVGLVTLRRRRQPARG